MARREGGKRGKEGERKAEEDEEEEKVGVGGGENDSGDFLLLLLLLAFFFKAWPMLLLLLAPAIAPVATERVSLPLPLPRRSDGAAADLERGAGAFEALLPAATHVTRLVEGKGCIPSLLVAAFCGRYKLKPER